MSFQSSQLNNAIQHLSLEKFFHHVSDVGSSALPAMIFVLKNWYEPLTDVFAAAISKFKSNDHESLSINFNDFLFGTSLGS